MPGISGKVDSDISYVDYPSIIMSWEHNKNKFTKPIPVKKSVDDIKNEFWNKYSTVAKDIINGKYGNGEERKNKMRDMGIDYGLVQEIVSNML